jgi:hypothetical protein
MSKIKREWTMQQQVELLNLYYNVGLKTDALATHYDKSTNAINIQLRRGFSLLMGVGTSVEAWSKYTDNANKHAVETYKVNTKTIG